MDTHNDRDPNEDRLRRLAALEEQIAELYDALQVELDQLALAIYHLSRGR
jgi:hypothetical protein